jgi:hypothetical protein
MSALQQIFRQYGPAYLARYGEAMPMTHRKALQAMMACRDGSFGHHVYQCEGCGRLRALPCACGNRHCPNCQHHKAERWLHHQSEKLLPCHYFLITFTVPEPMRRFLREHQKIAYDALFDAGAGALKKLARDKRFLGADQIGFFGVLHTWGRQIQYHPHIHFVVAGGGLSAQRDRWLEARADLFVHVRPLAKIYRAKFRDAMQAAGLLEAIHPDLWKTDWNVHAKLVGSGRGALKYAAAYVYRVAIGNSRILDVRDDKVTFRYQEKETGRWRTATLEAMEFLRRFLQHTLPTGFMKLRHYGFLSPNAAVRLGQIRTMILAFYDVLREILDAEPAPQPRPVRCPHCRKPMVHAQFVPAAHNTG